MSKDTQEKAQRMISEGRVVPLVLEATCAVFVVKGDTRTYLTTVLSPGARAVAIGQGAHPGGCTCEARSLCSHLLAADAVYKATGA